MAMKKAIEMLRKAGEKLEPKRAGRETAFGRFGIYCGLDKPTGAMVELKCESAPVAQNEEFIQLANDLAHAAGDRAGRGDGRRAAGAAVAEQSGADAGASRRRTCSIASARSSTSGDWCVLTGRVAATATTPRPSPACFWRSREERTRWPRTSACTSPPCVPRR